MASLTAGLIDLKSLKKTSVERLFFFTKQIKQQKISSKLNGNVVLGFFESSTRTRVSFEMAANNAGLDSVLFEKGQSTSLEKGETIEDTLLNLAAMKPRAFVIRCNKDFDLTSFSQKISTPIICAGWGVTSHPTQALLDLFTISENFDTISAKKILFVGDLLHSRVFASHFELQRALQLDIGVLSTEALTISDVKKFDHLDEALSWCDVVISLRSQFERFQSGYSLDHDRFCKRFRIDSERMKLLKPSAVLMHPGPVCWDWELAPDVKKDPRCKILNQVENGVYLREAVLRAVLGELEL